MSQGTFTSGGKWFQRHAAISPFNALGTEKRYVSLSSRYHQRQARKCLSFGWTDPLSLFWWRQSSKSTISTSWIHRYFLGGPKWRLDNTLFQWKVSPQMRTNPPPPFNSTSNPHTMQAKDCAWMCTQVMVANRERNPPPHLSVRTLVWLLSPCCTPKQCTTNREAIESNPWDRADIVSCRLWCYLPLRWSGLESYIGRQAHTWEGWAAFLGTQWCVFITVKKTGFVSAARLSWKHAFF